MACAQRLIDIGADVNRLDGQGRVDGQGWSALTLLLTLGCHPRRHRDAGVGEFINLVRVLLNNGATQTEKDIRRFETLLQKPRCCREEDGYCVRLRREFHAQFFLQDGKIVARDQPSYDEVTLVEGTEIDEDMEKIELYYNDLLRWHIPLWIEDSSIREIWPILRKEHYDPLGYPVEL